VKAARLSAARTASSSSATRTRNINSDRGNERACALITVNQLSWKTKDGQQAWSRARCSARPFSSSAADLPVSRRNAVWSAEAFFQQRKWRGNLCQAACPRYVRRPWTQTLRATRGKDWLMVIVALDGAESDGSYSRHDVRSSCIKTNELHTNGTVAMQGLITPEGQLGRG